MCNDTRNSRSRLEPRPTGTTPPLSGFAATAIALELLLGSRSGRWRTRTHGGAPWGDPSAPGIRLSGSPFANYFIPGAVLFTILGIGPLGAAVLAWRRHPVAPLLTFAVGGALLIWLVVEIVVVGYSNDPPLQALYFGLGIVISLVGVSWMRQAG